MKNSSKSKCTSTSHQLLVDNANNRLNDLQERFTNLQAARKEGRTSDVVFLEEQVCQSLREWKAELRGPSPASSVNGSSIGLFSDDIARLLQLIEEEDDATSLLAEPAVLKPEPFVESTCRGNLVPAPEAYIDNSQQLEHEFQGFDQYKGPASDMQNSNTDLTSQLNYLYNIHQDLSDALLCGSAPENCQESSPNILQNIPPPPSAFLGPKCALWDCARPAQGSEWYGDYCSSFHATLASSEDPPGSTPVLRPGGISLKDNLLLNALLAKTQGKNVGIPKCEGATITKCPWNASELFDLSLLEGETIREWLFFDKPRRAYDSGSRKQRSLPDYSGRGWHESRKQVYTEYGGQKRSYYMDPQPPGCFEWHLYEYEIHSCDVCALYRLELKLFSEKKKSPKGKVTKDPLVDLQKKMGRLTAEVPSDDNKPSIKGRKKANIEGTTEDISSSGH